VALHFAQTIGFSPFDGGWWQYAQSLTAFRLKGRPAFCDLKTLRVYSEAPGIAADVEGMTDDEKRAGPGF
jgi:hypothetical protein